MAAIRRSALFSKLNPTAYKSVESATLFCKMRGNPNVELVHWLHQILAGQDSDLHRIVKNFGLDASRLAADLTAQLDKLPRGATAISNFSIHLEGAVERGWVFASLLFNATRVRTGHLVIGLLKTPDLAPFFVGLSREFPKINVETLTDNFAGITAGSPEEGTDQPEAAAGASSGGASTPAADGSPAPAAMGKGEALAKYSVDLTERARRGEIDPVLGRDAEIRQVIDILMRRRQNNPLLAGEAGVGKTAVVEGFAARIAKGDVPPALKDVSLRSLDMGLLQAGASMKGEFENRLRQVIEEVQSSPKPVILFIDEAHTLIGAGGAAGTGDAANLLKPALARGTLRTIAATTWAEYKKYIEKDPALTRRFQAIKVEEPSEDVAVQMIRGLSATLEKHHQVLILDEALEAAARLSHRYIPSRQLPDKAVSLIDTACARVAVSQHATPAALEDSTRRIENLQTELDILARETALGRDSVERTAKLQAEMAEEKARRGILDVRHQEEKTAVEKIFALRAQLQDYQTVTPEPAAAAAASSPAATATPAPPVGTNGTTAPAADVLTALRAAEAELKTIQGEEPLILPSVDEQAVAAVVADWTGIPVGRMVRDEIQAVLRIADTLEKRVIGQRHALDGIAKRIQTARARLDNPNKPIGVFLLAGTSGVGKTETALALAEVLYGGEQNLITINMSEFQEAHTVSTLKGAPPGYVGYGEGGVLTEAVRRRPYSVVLLDEVEKAHADVHEIFFQVFDKGMMEDGEGRLIDFHNTVIILTSNAGSDLIASLCQDPDLMPDPEGIAKALRPALLKVFPAALLGRLTVVPYYPLSDEMLKSIIRLQLGRIERRLLANHGTVFTYGEDAVDLIASRCTENESGGRMIDAILTQTLLPEISREFLRRMADGVPVKTVTARVRDKAFTYDFA